MVQHDAEPQHSNSQKMIEAFVFAAWSKFNLSCKLYGSLEKNDILMEILIE